MFLPHENNIELNIMQNIYTGMELISLIPPWYWIWKQQEWKCTEYYKQPLNKMYSFNNMLILC